MSNNGPPPDYPRRGIAAKARAFGNKFIIRGASTSMVVGVAALGGLALGASLMVVFVDARRDRAWEDKFDERGRAWDSRFEQQERSWHSRFEQQERSWQNRFEMQLQQYKETQVSCKLTERRQIDLESYALLNGWKVPKDDQHGPLGNVERMTGKTTGVKK